MQSNLAFYLGFLFYSANFLLYAHIKKQSQIISELESIVLTLERSNDLIRENILRLSGKNSKFIHIETLYDSIYSVVNDPIFVGSVLFAGSILIVLLCLSFGTSPGDDVGGGGVDTPTVVGKNLFELPENLVTFDTVEKIVPFQPPIYNSNWSMSSRDLIQDNALVMLNSTDSSLRRYFLKTLEDVQYQQDYKMLLELLEIMRRDVFKELRSFFSRPREIFNWEAFSETSSFGSKTSSTVDFNEINSAVLETYGNNFEVSNVLTWIVDKVVDLASLNAEETFIEVVVNNSELFPVLTDVVSTESSVQATEIAAINAFNSPLVDAALGLFGTPGFF